MNCTVHPESAAISYCRTCGKPMCEVCRRNVRGTFYCEECIANRLQDAMPPAGASAPIPPITPSSHAPSPGLAAVLGFIPGVGAMYNGQFAKALIHVLVFVSIIWITSNGSGFFGIFIPFFVFYMVFDAYKTARARELGLPLPDPFGLESLFGGGAPLRPPMPPVPPVAPPPAGAPGTGEAGNPNVAGFVPGTAAPSGQTAEQYWQNYPQNLGNQIRSDVYEGMRQRDIASRRGNAAPIGAVILIVLGALFLLDNIGIWHFNFDRFWPLILIAIGIWLLIRRLGLLESHGKEQQ